jgi:hypothetical protein
MINVTYSLRLATLCLVAMALAFFSVMGQTARKEDKEKGIRIVPNEAERRIDVLVDGQLFTSYIYPKTLTKPVLYPLKTSTGTLVTRSYPPRTGERVDHPHHVGMWFNYGDVNNVDFWNNSVDLPIEKQKEMGSIVHRRIVRSKDGKEKAEFDVEADWIMPDGKPILREFTRYIFQASASLRSVDRITTLTALDKQVVFKDNKEGVLGIRLARFLEHPSKTPEVFADASGRPTKVPVLDNEGVTGVYHSSEGKIGEDVWGTRGKWVMLTGQTGTEKVTLAILDHKKNPNHPTYWHARGYGLFAANPLGQKIFAEAKKEQNVKPFNFKLGPKTSVTFKHRVLIFSGTVNIEQIKSTYEDFNKD